MNFAVMWSKIVGDNMDFKLFIAAINLKRT